MFQIRKSETRVSKTSNKGQPTSDENSLPKKMCATNDNGLKEKTRSKTNNCFKLEIEDDNKTNIQSIQVNSRKKISNLSDTVKCDLPEPECKTDVDCVGFSRKSLSQFFEQKKLNSTMPKQISGKVSSSPGCTSKLIDLSLPITKNGRQNAKMNALNYIKNHGPIKKIDPNGTRGHNDSARKRTIDKLNNSLEENTPESEGNCILSERFVELMNKSSKHEGLLKAADDIFLDDYFHKMSKKEDMEEKMLNTFKVPCKAVKCLKCKYTWFSASDLCKLEGHPIKVVDRMKRFFSCNGCGNRTVSLEVIPLLNCKQCGSANWKRAPLLSEKKTMANLKQLSVRGDEEKFLNSFKSNINLNLLVPE